MVRYGYGKEASPKHVELGLDPHGRAGRKVQVGQRQHREHHRGHTSSGSASEGSSASSGGDCGSSSTTDQRHRVAYGNPRQASQGAHQHTPVGQIQAGAAHGAGTAGRRMPMTDDYDWPGTGAQTPDAEQPFTSKFSLRGKVGGYISTVFGKNPRENVPLFVESLNPRRRKVRSPDSEISEHVLGYQKLSHKKGGTLKRLLTYPRVIMIWIWTPHRCNWWGDYRRILCTPERGVPSSEEDFVGAPS